MGTQDLEASVPATAVPAGSLSAELLPLTIALESFEAQVKTYQRDLVAEYGSVENAIRFMLKESPALRKATVEWHRLFRKVFQAIVASEIRSLVVQLGNVPDWQALAARDPHEFARQMEAHMRTYKRLLRLVCDQPSHRPIKNQARDRAIWEIKTSRSELSFGQVVQEYKRQTGETISAKNAERIFKRAKRRYDSWLNPARWLRYTAVIRRVHQTLKPSVAKS